MKKIVFIAGLILVNLFGMAQPPKPSENPDAYYLIDHWLSAQRDYDRLPGISVAIVNDQDIAWSKGYGFSNVEARVPMQTATLCSICSVSKLFTSVAIMQLVEKGKIRLDDSIQAVLPSFNLQQQYANSGPITIRSLLTHSSGLPRESDFPYWSAPDFNFPAEKQVKEKLGTQKSLYPASTYFQYSNLGMTILGELIEHVSGMPYEQYVEQNILIPLKLTHTHPYLPQNEWGHGMALGYGSLHRDGHREKMPFFQANGIAPAAGYSSNVEDLGRFASWQFRLVANGGTEILRASTLKDMQRVQFMDPDWKTSWGLGFIVSNSNGTTIVGHGGSCPGSLTSLVIDMKNKLAIVAMLNGQGENLEKYTQAIQKILKLSKSEEKNASNDTTNLDAYMGNYDAYAFGSELLVFRWKGKLAMIGLRSTDPSADIVTFKHISGDKFVRIRADESMGEELFFERDQHGKVIRLWRNSNFSNKIVD